MIVYRNKGFPFGEAVTAKAVTEEGGTDLPNPGRKGEFLPHLFRHGLRRATFPEGEGLIR